MKERKNIKWHWEGSWLKERKREKEKWKKKNEGQKRQRV